MGLKSPLAYSSSFYLVIRKNFVERKYMMYEGEDKNSIDLLYEQKTKERNGVKIIVPVNYEDKNQFISKIQEQLSYFKDVYFNVPEIGNTHSIYTGKHFQHSELIKTKSMHICLDDVYYPIDWEKLEISPINVPIGLKFDLNSGLTPIPSREGIIYSTSTKNLILEKIKLASTELVNMYNEKYNVEVEPLEGIKLLSNNNKILKLKNLLLDIENLEKYSTSKFNNIKIKGVEKLDLNSLVLSNLLVEYSETHFLDWNNSFRARRWGCRLTVSNIINNNYNFALYEHSLVGNRLLYVKEIYNRKLHQKVIYFIKKKFSLKLKKDTNSYYSLLKLKKHPKEDWRQIIQEFQLLRDSLIGTIENVSKLEIPEDWLKELRRQRREKQGISSKKFDRKKLKEEIACKLGQSAERGDNNCKWVAERLYLEKIDRQSKVYIYDLHDNKHKLDLLYPIANKSNTSNIYFITVSPRTKGQIEKNEFNNLISYEKFMEGKHSAFKKIATGELVYQLKQEQEKAFNGVSLLKEVDEKLYNAMIKIKNYPGTYNRWSISLELMDDILSIAENNNLFDDSVYEDYLYAKEKLDKYPFYRILGYSAVFLTSETNNILDLYKQLYKCNKLKMNVEHYLKKEETVEQ